MYPPVEKYGISSPYGPRGAALHHGIDCPCPTGTPLPAVSDGVVVFEGHIPAAAAGYQPEVICIIQSEGYFITYGHLSQTLVSVGERVKQGGIIAYSGNTGYVLPKPLSANDKQTGSHLHVQKNLGTKAPSKGINAYPSEDITPLLQAYGGHDMTLEEAKIKLQAEGWRSHRDFNWQALYEYYLASQFKDEQARDVATSHVESGSSFRAVIESDLQWYREQLTKVEKPPVNDQDIQDLELGRKARRFIQDALQPLGGGK
jgi:hypothetical protein